MPGLLLGCLVLILLVFAQIFSNVWGYIQPVSLFFRGKFWLAFFLPAGGISLLAWLAGNARLSGDGEPAGRFPWAWAVLLAGICLGTLAGALPVKHFQVQSLDRPSITVMTFNIQAANDANAQKSFERQLAIIRKVSPDIVAMQETDTARISLNNNDYVRFYADNLGYYSYYGPSTVAGTFGTAILSKYPLRNTRSVYTYSDTDEIGVAEAEIEVDGLPITIYDVHPDGSDLAKMTFVKALLQRSPGQTLCDRPGRLQPAGYHPGVSIARCCFHQRLDQCLPHQGQPGWRGYVRGGSHRPYLRFPFAGRAQPGLPAAPRFGLRSPCPLGRDPVKHSEMNFRRL